MIKNNVFKAITSWQLVAKSIFIGLVLLLMSCEKESYRSDDYVRSKELLPNKKEYVDDDLGTRSLAKAIEGHYSSKLSMIIMMPNVSNRFFISLQVNIKCIAPPMQMGRYISALVSFIPTLCHFM